MRLGSLRLINYKLYKDLIIKFFDGIFAIIGPNGSGKSTIIEAMLFSLFGKKAISDFKDLINFNSDRCSLTLDFSVKNKNYRIKRELRKSKKGKVQQSKCEFLEVLDTEETFLLAEGQSNADPLIEKTIGFKYTELTHSNIISQKKLDKISKLTAQQWKDLLNEFLNLKGFGEAGNELKNEKREMGILLENDKLRFAQLDEKKDEYWSRFKKLCKASRDHLRNSMSYRKLNSLIEINANYLEIVKDFIEKRLRKIELNNDKRSKGELLKEKRKQLKNIENVEKENETLKLELEQYKEIEKIERILRKIEENFQQYQNNLKDFKELHDKLHILEELEEELEKLEIQIKPYEEAPEQLIIFREISSLFKSLEVSHDERDELKEKLNNIRNLEERNKELYDKLDFIEDSLSNEEKYHKAEKNHIEFKALLDKSKIERNQKKTLEHEIYQSRAKCPNDTPEDVPGLKNFKQVYEQHIASPVNFLIKSSKWNIPVILGLILLTIIPAIFGLIPVFVIGITLLISYSLKLLYSFSKTKALIQMLEELIFKNERILEIEPFLKKATEMLSKQYSAIKDIITSLPPFYSDVFKHTEVIEEQEYNLSIYFQTESEKIKKIKDEKIQINEEITRNKRIINNKQEFEERFKICKESIEETRIGLGDQISRLRNVYLLENIDKIHGMEIIEFYSVKLILSNIEKLIQSDLDKYRELNNEILTIKKELEIKPTVLKKLEKIQQEKTNSFNSILELTMELDQKYKKLVGDDNEIKLKIEQVAPLRKALNKINDKIKDDLNKFNQITAQIEANNNIIKNKPKILEEIKNITKKISNIKAEINKIIFPEIPIEIKDNFDKENPEQCRDTLEIKIRGLEEQKNKLFGVMRSLNSSRNEIRQYLKDNEFVIHEFFEKQSEIKQLEWDIRIANKSIDLIEQVNRIIWDRQMPHITSYIMKFLPKITMGRYRTMKIEQTKTKKTKRYQFKVLEETSGTYIDKELLSGGTEDQVLLALRVAFAMSLLPQSKGHYPKFLFLDESFSSSDSERRLEILNWIKDDLSAIFSQIIIISHIQEIIDNIPFHYTLSLGKIIEKVLPVIED